MADAQKVTDGMLDHIQFYRVKIRKVDKLLQGLQATIPQIDMSSVFAELHRERVKD